MTAAPMIAATVLVSAMAPNRLGKIRRLRPAKMQSAVRRENRSWSGPLRNQRAGKEIGDRDLELGHEAPVGYEFDRDEPGEQDRHDRDEPRSAADQCRCAVELAEAGKSAVAAEFAQ